MMTIMNTHTYRCRPRARAARDLPSFPLAAWLGLCCGLAAKWGGSLSAADWPQYRGPTHDGKTSERLLKTWPTGGLKQVWKIPTTDGFSVFSVGHGRAFTLVARELDGVRREVCLALDADTGKELWAAPLGAAKYDGGGDSGASDNKGGDGPRSTPTVDGDRVYVLDAHLLLVCLEAKTGKPLWSNDLVTSMGARNIAWQNAASPVLDGDVVFVCCGAPGQSLVAFNKRDGSVLWKGENDAMTHASPVPATIHGVRQVIFFTQPGLVSVDAKTGKVLWRYGFRYSVSTAASPIVAGDIVYCSAGYGVGSAAVRIQKNGADFSATELWRLTGNKVANHWSTPVLKDGHLSACSASRNTARARSNASNSHRQRGMGAAPVRTRWSGTGGRRPAGAERPRRVGVGGPVAGGLQGTGAHPGRHRQVLEPPGRERRPHLRPQHQGSRVPGGRAPGLHQVTPLMAKQTVEMVIEAVTMELPDTKTIRLKWPDGYDPQFKTGQFITLFWPETTDYKRAYSLCSCALDRGYFEVSVKRDGKMGTRLVDWARVGDKLWVLPPTGRFLPVYEPNKHLLCIAGGSGVTPFRAFAREATKSSLETRITVLYSVRTTNDIIFDTEFRQLEQDNRQFSFYVT